MNHLLPAIHLCDIPSNGSGHRLYPRSQYGDERRDD